MRSTLFHLPFSTENCDRFRYLARYVTGRWQIYVIGVVAAFIGKCAEALIPKAIQWSIELLQGSSHISFLENIPQKDAFHSVTLIVGIAIFISFLSKKIIRHTTEHESAVAGTTLRSALWRRIRRAPLPSFDHELTPGRVLNVASSDSDIARMILGYSMRDFLDFLISFIVIIGAITSIYPLAGLSVFIVIFSIGPLSGRLVTKMQRQFHQAQELMGELSEGLSRFIGTIRLQKISRTALRWIDGLVETGTAYRDSRFKGIRTRMQFQLCVDGGRVLMITVVSLLGVHAMLQHTLSAGGLIALLLYVGMLQGPLEGFGYFISESQRSLQSLARIIDLAMTKEDQRFNNIYTPTDHGNKENPAAIAVSDVSFKYPNTQNPVLRDVSFDLNLGEVLGISSPLGSGKSTLLHLIAGLRTDFKGSINLFGHNVKELPPPDIAAFVSLVHQRPLILSGTIRSNLILDRQLHDEELWNKLHVVDLDTDVRGFPAGLDTLVGEFGITLSGGQRQRLSIARALLSCTPLLLFDDCLSAVDTKTELRLLHRLKPEIEQRTVVWVASRASTLRLATSRLELGGELQS